MNERKAPRASIGFPSGGSGLPATGAEGTVLGVVAGAPAWTNRIGSKMAHSALVPPAVGASAFSWIPSYTVAGVPNGAEISGDGSIIIGNPKGAQFPNDMSVRALTLVSDGPNEDSAAIRSYMYRDSLTFGGGVLCRRAGGSIAARTAVPVNMVLGSLQGMAYHGVDTLNGGWSANIAKVSLVAAEAQTNTAAGTRIDLEVTALGAAARRVAASVRPGGEFLLNNIATAGAIAPGATASVIYCEGGVPKIKNAANVVFPFVQQANIANPAGGAVVDVEARTAIDAILAVLDAFAFTA